MKPTAVLVEGPADATELVKHFAHKETRPPVAILAYTRQRPVRSILYPLASYSPEWVALSWGMRNKADVRFIDLPASVFLELHHAAPPDLEEEPAPQAQPPAAAAKPQASDHTLAYLDDPWEEIARISGDPDYMRHGGNGTSSTPTTPRPTSGKSSSSAAACAGCASWPKRTRTLSARRSCVAASAKCWKKATNRSASSWCAVPSTPRR